jgi:Carbamate kinase
LKAVIALGGNALRKKGEGFDFETHYENAYFTFLNLIEAGIFSFENKICITHGNGPQVGMEFMRNFFSKEKFPIYPLDSLTASTQGWIGYILERALRKIFSERGINRGISTLITLVEVDKDDPSLKNPTKPIGDFLNEEEAKELSIMTGLQVKMDSNRGWRFVVGSPEPLRILNADTINSLLEMDNVVIAVGGGGIPVDRDLNGVPAVIDKDLASSLLAREIGADIFIILTEVPEVYINFGKPNQKPLHNVSVSELKKYLEERHFAPGSMEPKIRAVIKFLESGGKEALITSPEHLKEALEGRRGTWIK